MHKSLNIAPAADLPVPLTSPGVQVSSSTVRSERKRLQRALDWLHDERELFLGEYEVLNFLARRKGGQGVVQFMKRHSDGLEFAVKFFQAREGALQLCGLLNVVHCCCAQRNYVHRNCYDRLVCVESCI